jgi:hypothetical protein
VQEKDALYSLGGEDGNASLVVFLVHGLCVDEPTEFRMAVVKKLSKL